jgi:hypothetical protein
MTQNRMPDSVRQVEQRAAGSPASKQVNGSPRPEPPASRPGMNLTRREAPKLFQFDARGVTVSGILRSCERIEINNDGKLKKPIQYGIYNERERQEYKILGTYDINCKLRWPEDKGRYVEITFVGENQSVVRNGRALREFDVQVDEVAPAKPSDSLEITDEDIPF